MILGGRDRYIVITALILTILSRYLDLITWRDTCLDYSSIAPVACAWTPYNLEVVNMPSGNFNFVSYQRVEQF